MGKLKYGEAHTKVKLSLHMKDGEFKSIKLPDHEKRMGKDEASEYYTNKIRKHYGLPNKSTLKEYEKINKEYFKKDDMSMLSFDKPEDKYGYYEALKIKETLCQQ